MTYGYDLERLVVTLEAVDVAAGMLFRHELTEWLAYRLLHIRADVRSLKAIIDEHNQKKGSRDMENKMINEAPKLDKAEIEASALAVGGCA